MIDALKLLSWFVVSLFRSKGRLEAEMVILRYQLNVLRRRTPTRPRLTLVDRLIFVWLYRLRPSLLSAVVIVQPETVVRWHCEGFRLYWRWKSRARGGRPQIPSELRRLIREMSLANPLWGAPRIHGELLKLGSRSPSRQWPNTWREDGRRRARAGRPFCATTRPASSRCMCWSFSATVDDRSCRSASRPIRRRSGSLDRSPTHFRGLKLRAT